jgi:hypothetical protein
MTVVIWRIAIVVGVFSVIGGGADFFALVLMGHVPKTHAGTWAVMAATAASVSFVAWNRSQALVARPLNSLRRMTSSRVAWSVPLVFLCANLFLWWTEGTEQALGHSLLSAAAVATFISLPIASWLQLEHAESNRLLQRCLHYVLEGRDISGTWQVIEKFADDPIALGRSQDAAFEDSRWQALRLTFEECSRRVVEKERRNEFWNRTELLANGRPDVSA